MFKLLDLFSGIGGFSLGLERGGGFKTVAFCEIEEYPRRVLAKHWPGVPIYGDVRTLTEDRLAADGIAVDAICGGFPCQDISSAGKGAGMAGERSGLWSEYARLVGELRPRYVIVENVAALLGRGLGRVLGDLAALGYDAEWHCIPASAVGAPHRRDRIWIVSYPASSRLEGTAGAGVQWGNNGLAWCSHVANATRLQSGRQEQRAERERARSCREPEFTERADADQSRSQGRVGAVMCQCADERVAGESGPLLHTNGSGSHAVAQRGIHSGEEISGPWYGQLERSDWWLVEPDVGRVANGVSARVDRLKGLGNAVVPQIPELIGRSILAREAMTCRAR